MTGKHRLFIEKITSVGAVEQADNPHSSIVFWKSRPKPEPTRLEKAVQRKRNVEAIRKWAEESDAQLAEIRKGLEELRGIPLSNEGGDMPTTKEDIRKQRDQWVDENRAKDESPLQARARFWKEHPELKDAERGAPSAGVAKDAPTFGETVTAAIERRARQYHVDDPRTLDKSIPELKTHIRRSVPALKRLERNTETVDIAKSAYAKSVDPQVQAALDFVKTWSE